MKRIVALILCTVLCIGIFAGCGEEKEEAGSGVFSVGYGMADVTPTESIPLDGYAGADSAQYRRSASTEWPLQVITIAFTDGTDRTLLFVTLDFLNAYMADSMREAISAETGVPKEHIMFHVTHNHSGPSLRVEHPAIPPYITQLTGSVLNSAKTARSSLRCAAQQRRILNFPKALPNDWRRCWMGWRRLSACICSPRRRNPPCGPAVRHSRPRRLRPLPSRPPSRLRMNLIWIRSWRSSNE